MSGEATLSFRVTISFLSLVILLMFTPSQLIFAQSSTKQLPFLTQKESIKILGPVTTQNATVGKDLLISGQSSDDVVKNCSVSVIVNDIRPYQNAFARGTEGMDDFSRWEFALSNNYTHVIEGVNKITAKLLCESAPTRWYSVFVNGIPNLSNVQIAPPQSSQIQSVERSNVSETNLSNIEESGNNDSSLLVSILAQKNPIARGNIQNTTITVTDSAKRPITNAEINGKLIYPGNNFEKEFVGKTDYNGLFIYSWTIGKKGDVGPLTVEVDASSQGYQSSFITNSFDIVDSSEAPIQSVQRSNVSETNLSNIEESGNNESLIQSLQRSNVSKTNLSNIEESGNNNTSLLVSILAQKNPIARGDIQNTTITVTDSAKRPITNAEINGKLIYPGNNFEKEFVGKTDYNGMFIYSWTIGKKGDVGPLTVEVDASSQGYQSSFITNSFDIVDSSEAPIQSVQRSNVSETNLSNIEESGNNESLIQSVQRSNVSETNLSNIEESGNNNTSLLVSILAQKNPIARGDIQNTTITVTDSAKRPITNAEINGKLIYPGNNFEKEFVGKTDYNGMFIYSWTIGKKGDVGPLTVEVDASSQGYQSSFITSSFDIVDSSEALKDNSTLGGNLDIQDSTLGGN